jgi:hypothetical protein
LVLKFCQVVLLSTLGITANRMAVAQTLPPDPVANPILVASENPGGPFSGRDSPLPSAPQDPPKDPPKDQLMAPMAPATSPNTPSASVPYQRLTANDRLNLFLNETYESPGAFAGLFAGALVDQIRHTPAQWGEGGSGYTRRFASEYGQLAARNAIHDGLAGLTGLDPRYSPCRCDGRLRRGAHALKMSFTTYRQDGRLTLDVPQIAGAYGSGIISTYWYPHGLYTPLGEGIMFGHEQMGEIMVGNLVREFAPDLRRGLHLHSFAAFIRAHSSDDD